MLEVAQTLLLGEALAAGDFLGRQPDHVLYRHGDRAAVAAQYARTHGPVEIPKIVGPDLRKQHEIIAAFDVAAHRLALEHAPNCLVLFPARNGNLPYVVDIRIVLQQAGTLARYRPGDMSLRMVMAQLPGQNRGVKAVAVGAKLAQKDSLHDRPLFRLPARHALAEDSAPRRLLHHQSPHN